MRRTVITGILLLSASGMYYTAKHLAHSELGTRTSSKVFHSSASRKKISRNKKIQTLHQGEQHESASHRSRQQVESDIESVGSEEGGSSSFEQAESLPSIYQDEELESTRSAVNLEDEINSESDENSPNRQKQPVVYGVPVASWLKHSKNQLPSKVEAPTQQGVRVFFNCMELKEDRTAPLSQKECKEIAVSREKSRGAALIQ